MRTNAGRDLQARQMGDTASSATGVYAPANFIGLTSNANAPTAASTALTGEITGGTLARKKGVYAHTNGTNSYTVTATFIADQSVTVNKVGVFNAATGGTLAFESLLNAPAVLVSGDQVQITETVTL